MAGGSVGQLAGKLEVSLEELEQLKKMNEEERERSSSRRNGSRRAGSLDGDGSESPASRSSLKPTSQRRQLYRKTLSVSDTISENDSMWKSQDSTGSRESLASNTSIPLPVPVRTRSTGHGSESGYSSDYNNIRRIERDTSVDRLSSGSKESNRSTQSEWLGRDKRKKSGLIGKLKKLTRGLSAERPREFGSGSDISSVSVTSNAPTTPRPQGSSGAPGHANAKSATLPRNSGSSANEPFDQYFKKASTSGLGTQRPAPATPSRESHSRVNPSSSHRRWGSHMFTLSSPLSCHAWCLWIDDRLCSLFTLVFRKATHTIPWYIFLLIRVYLEKPFEHSRAGPEPHARPDQPILYYFAHSSWKCLWMEILNVVKSCCMASTCV